MNGRQDAYLLILIAIGIWAFYSKPVAEPATLNANIFPNVFSVEGE